MFRFTKSIELISKSKKLVDRHMWPFDIYLAVPYSHEFKSCEQMRFTIVTKMASYLTERGVSVYSPITHCHPMVKVNPELGTNWLQWLELDKRIMPHCQILAVYCIPGWYESEGVRAEVREAMHLGMEIVYIPYEVK